MCPSTVRFLGLGVVGRDVLRHSTVADARAQAGTCDVDVTYHDVIKLHSIIEKSRNVRVLSMTLSNIKVSYVMFSLLS